MSVAPDPWLFDDFQPGHRFGTLDIALDSTRVGFWLDVFDGTVSEGPLPSSVLVAAMMEGYLELLRPRPPGNVHASQALRFTGAEVRAGDVVTVALECRDKFLKKDRRWAVFGATISRHGIDVMQGDITTIWAK